MLIWSRWLAETPAALQLLIARTHRISLPRRGAAAERLRRIRRALCRARVVRATYAMLPAAIQAATQTLRAEPHGLTLSTLTARYGPLRPLRAMQADRQPRSISEHLLLLGWLLPRPATRNHPARYRLAPEVCRWVPQPLGLPDLGAAPPSAPLPPALRATTTLLLTVATQPVPLCRAGYLRRRSVRPLLPRLAPLDLPAVTALYRFLLPLLIDLGLLAPHGDAATLAPAGQRFLDLPVPTQLAHLRRAWLRTRGPEAWLRPLLITDHGIDWVVFRRRLTVWAEQLPVTRCVPATGLYPALAAALGPLADAQTHGYRRVDRVPWQPKRAAAIWDAALAGPLHWLGWVQHGQDAPGDPWVAALPPDAAAPLLGDAEADAPLPLVPAAPAPPWQYGDPGVVIVPHAATRAAVLRLLPFGTWQAADDQATVYRITPRQVAQAHAQGTSLSQLWAVLTAQAGPCPPGWDADLPAAPVVRVTHAAVVQSDPPMLLDQLLRDQRTVRRYLTDHLAPGLAMTVPDQVPALQRALERQDVAVTVTDAPATPAPLGLSAAECATLLAACAFYRQHAPDAAPLPPTRQLEARLRAALPAALRTATDALVATLQPTRPAPDPDAVPAAPAAARPQPPIPPAAPAPARPPAAADRGVGWIDPLRTAITRRALVDLTYTTGPGTTTARQIRPIRLEEHGGQWYLHAHCTLRQAERLFRLDRIHDLTVVGRQPRRGNRRALGLYPPPPPPDAPVAPPVVLDTAGKPAPTPAPRRAPVGAGFFPEPPASPPGSPLVQVWLVDEPQ